MKLKNLTFGALSLLLFAACNSSDDVVREKEEASVKLTVKVPQAGTRGVVTDPSGKDIVVKTLWGHVFKGNSQAAVASADYTGVAGPYILNFPSIMVDGTEEVEVVINNTGSPRGLFVDKVQPDAANGKLENMIYVAAAPLGTTIETDASGKKTYKVSAEAASIASRLEVFGATPFNTELVKSMRLSYITPSRYLLKYGLGDKLVQPSQSSLSMTLTEEQSTEIYADKSAEPTRVVANHLFVGSEASLTVGFAIDKYDCYKNGTGRYVAEQVGDKKNFIYKAKNNNYYINRGTVATPSYYKCAPTVEGGSLKLNIEENVTTDDVVLAVVNSVEYFRLGKFAGMLDNRYEAGKIYKLNINGGITWNPNGANPNVFDPETNTGTDNLDETENKKEAVVEVTVQVAPWMDVNTSVEVQ